MTLLIILLVSLMSVTQVSCRCERRMAECKSGFHIMDRNLPDSALSVSSNYDSNYFPARARMDKYISETYCVWAPANKWGGLPHWIQVDLQQKSTVTGVVIRKRCDPYGYQYVRSYEIQVRRGSNWETIYTANLINYRFGKDHFAFFDAPVCGRNFRVLITNFNSHPSLKFDLIGCI